MIIEVSPLLDQIDNSELYIDAKRNHIYLHTNTNLYRLNYNTWELVNILYSYFGKGEIISGYFELEIDVFFMLF